MGRMEYIKNKYSLLVKGVNYWPDARDIIKDVEYFQEFIRRNRINKRFSFTVLPSQQNTIMNWFVKELFYSPDFAEWKDENKLKELLIIYDVTSILIETLNNIVNDGKPPIKYIKRLIEWGDYLTYKTGMEIDKQIYRFVGSSYQIDKIFEAWRKYLGVEK